MGNSIDNIARLEKRLATSQRVLDILENQFAGYTILTVPPHLLIQLEQKQAEVDLLKGKLEEARSANSITPPNLPKNEQKRAEVDRAQKTRSARRITKPVNKEKDKTAKQKPTNKDDDALAFYLFERLNILHVDGYRLLCRLGCYRYEEIPTVNEENILPLFWDVSQESSPIEIIKSLCCRLLIEFENNKFLLHPEIHREARRRLRLSQEWISANKKIGDFYSNSIVNTTEETQVEAAFKAMNYYHTAGELEKCRQILMSTLEADENVSNLRCSDNLWYHTPEIIEICEQLIESNGLNGLDKATILIPLGVLYPEIGKNAKAVDISEEILSIVDSLPTENSNDQKTILAQVLAYLISARANKSTGNVLESLNACQNADNSVNEACKIIKDKSIAKYWQGLTLYELGTLYLEIAKTNEFFSEDTVREARTALYLFARCAYLAININIPKILYNLFINILKPTPSNTERIFAEIKNRSDKTKDNSRTKKFRVLHNLGKCTRLMNLPDYISQRLLKMALDFVPKTDNLNKAWSYLELALCSSTSDEAEGHYNSAKENYHDLPILCKAHVSLERGKFMCKQGDYTAAIEQHQELEKLLEKTELESLKAINYYSICQAYLAIKNSGEITSNDNFSFYLEESLKILKKLNLDYLDRIQELHVAFNS
jgi:hypothetical protein